MSHTELAPTPIKLDRLAHHLRITQYNPPTTQYLIDGFMRGFSLENTSLINTHPIRNSFSVKHNKDIVYRKLNHERLLGRIAGPFTYSPFHKFQISPLSVREKKVKGKYRLIHDLSFPYDSTSINANIPQTAKKVHYATVGNAIQILLHLPHSSYTAKTDIADAYRLIPIRPEDFPKLGIFFDGSYYYDKSLPQGCASLCKIFETLSTAIQAIFKFTTQTLIAFT